MRKTLIAAGCAALFVSSGFAGAGEGAVDTMPAALAHQVVDRTIELVESKGLYPRRQEEYAQARTEVAAIAAAST